MTGSAKSDESVPVWPFALLVAGLFAAFFYLMGAGFEQSIISSSAPAEESAQTEHDNKQPEDITFTIKDESPESVGFEYLDYPIARFAGGSVLYAAMGPADCPPMIDTVEYIDKTTLVITPKHYDDNIECSEDITAVVERISREDRNSIDRGNTDVIVINANIPENMIWEEPETEDHTHDHEHEHDDNEH